MLGDSFGDISPRSQVQSDRGNANPSPSLAKPGAFMKMKEFATLKRGDKIVARNRGICGFDVVTVVSEPYSLNTIVDALADDGKTYPIRYNDVLRRHAAQLS